MKKWTAILATMALVLALVGCGGDTTDSASGNNDPFIPPATSSLLEILGEDLYAGYYLDDSAIPLTHSFNISLRGMIYATQGSYYVRELDWWGFENSVGQITAINDEAISVTIFYDGHVQENIEGDTFELWYLDHTDTSIDLLLNRHGENHEVRFLRTHNPLALDEITNKHLTFTCPQTGSSSEVVLLRDDDGNYGPGWAWFDGNQEAATDVMWSVLNGTISVDILTTESAVDYTRFLIRTFEGHPDKALLTEFEKYVGPQGVIYPFKAHQIVDITVSDLDR